MATEASRPDIFIIRDDRGTCYVVPQNVLESWRVPEQLQDTAAALTGECEVSGYATPRSLVVQLKGLEAQDRMGNFEIQRLMSAYNQAETLSSSVQRKINDTNNSIVGKF
jgi:hypothetical protein